MTRLYQSGYQLGLGLNVKKAEADLEGGGLLVIFLDQLLHMCAFESFD